MWRQGNCTWHAWFGFIWVRENYTRAVLPHTSVYDVHTFITYNYTCDDREIIAVKQSMAVRFLRKIDNPIRHHRRWKSFNTMIPNVLSVRDYWICSRICHDWSYYWLIIIYDSFVNVVTSVVDVSTLITNVLTLTDDRVFGSDKLINICCSYKCYNIT